MTRTFGAAVVVLAVACSEPPAEERLWVASSLQVPVSASQSTSLGLDLDADGNVDNGLGRVQSALSSAAGLDFQFFADEQVDRGGALILFEAAAQSFEEDPTASVRVLEGSSSVPAACASVDDLLCRRHLDGEATFIVEAGDEAPLSALVIDSVLTGGPAAQRVPVIVPGQTVWVRATAVFLSAAISGTGLTTGKLAGGILAEDVETVVLPAHHAWVAERVSEDCTPSGCMADSTGQTLVNLYDTNDDFSVTLPEFTSNAIIQSVFAPDMDLIDAQGGYGSDGVIDSLSFGIAFEAVGAAIPTR